MDRESINFEILRIAKELVVNEYVDHRAQLHNQWLIESDQLWRTRRLRLAYPPIPPHPTEEDVVKRARLLLEFLNTTITVPEQPTPAPAPAEPVAHIESIEQAVVEQAPVEEVKEPEMTIVDIEPNDKVIGVWEPSAAEEKKPKKFPEFLKQLWSKDDKK